MPGKPLDFMPPGEVWVTYYDGEKTYTNSRGQRSTTRHAERIDPAGRGQTLSVHQYQKIQAEQRSLQGVPKPAPIARKGRIKTVNITGPRPLPQQVSQPGPRGGTTKKPRKTGFASSLYRTDLHGEIRVEYYYSLQEARDYVQNHPDQYQNFTNAMIQIKYTRRLTRASNAESDPRMKGGYATLFGYSSVYIDGKPEEFIKGAYIGGATINHAQNPWYYAELDIQAFDMTGPDARVFIYLNQG